MLISHGAGAGARQSVGTGVMGGMMAATFLAIFSSLPSLNGLWINVYRKKRTAKEIHDEAERHQHD